jgi:carbonic anhydrase
LTKLRLLNAYKGNFFRLQNSGHSVSVDFVGESGQNEGPTSKTFTFPDPLNLKQTREYKFASAHFHWGTNDKLGSEHCVGTKCSSAEVHFVHYSANFSSMADAVASGDESALNVLGVFIDASIVKNLIGKLSNTGHPSLAPIVKNLDSVHHASHDGGFVRVDQPIDFTPLIMNELIPQVYSYKGSLTTPGCNEQVNWFVMKAPAKVSSSDLQAFRTKLQDGNGAILNENHRPQLPLNGRKVSLITAIPTL